MSARTGTAARSWGEASVDTACLVVALAAGAAGFWPAFGDAGVVVAGGGGILLGAAVALAGFGLRLSALWTSLVAVVAYFLFGGALAKPETSLAGVVPTLETLRDLALGVGASWKSLLTAHPPVGVYDGVHIAPYLAGFVCSVVAVSVGVRTRHPAWALLPVGVLFVVAVAFGTDDPAWPVAQGLIAAAVGIGWISWRRSQARRAGGGNAIVTDDAPAVARLRMRTIGSAAIFAVIAVTLTAGVGAVAAPASARHVLRDAVHPPLDVHALASPLTAYRRYIRDDRKKVLFTVEGLPKGARVRLATLDGYDGIVYSVGADGGVGSGAFTEVGDSIPSSSTALPSPGTKSTLTFTIGALDGPWLPDAGYARSITLGAGATDAAGTARSSASGATASGASGAASAAGSSADDTSQQLGYNAETGTAVLIGGVSKGLTYTVIADIPHAVSASQLSGKTDATVALPVLTNVPDAVSQLAAKFVAGAKTPAQKAKDLQATFEHEGFFSDGLSGQAPSSAGHGEARIGKLLSSSQMVGDDEQYAVAMALMARKLGLPARVVMGFYPSNAKAGASGAVPITGADLHAWTEIAFDGVGWVAFDPTPPTSRQPQEAAPKPNPKPKTQVLQPPPTPKAQPTLPPDASSQKIKNTPRKKQDSLWGVIGAIAVWLGVLILLLAVLLAPPMAIAAAKRRRRARRREAEHPTARASGAWDELLDRADDWGTRAPSGGTRRETAAVLARPLGDNGVATVARRIDGSVFGPGVPTDSEIESLWQEVDRIVAGLGVGAGRLARLRARLSLRSLLRSRRGAERARRRDTEKG